MSKLELKNLTISYENHGEKNTIYSNYSQEFVSGIYCFTGESGCGKSTLMRTIVGLKEPDSGEILLDGVQVPKRTADIQMVHQHYKDFPWLTAEKNVELAYKVRKRKITKRVKKEIKGFLKSFGLLEQANKKVGDFNGEISGGQSQRLSICVALAAKPKLLLMDEPTSALDTENMKNVARIIKEYQRKTDSIIIIITHDPKFLIELGAKEILLDETARLN